MSRGVGIALAAALVAALLVIAFLLGRESRTGAPAASAPTPMGVPTGPSGAPAASATDTPEAAVESLAPTTAAAPTAPLASTPAPAAPSTAPGATVAADSQ